MLFLDEFGEFPAPLLDALRQPIEDGRVVVTRKGATVTFPSASSTTATAGNQNHALPAEPLSRPRNRGSPVVPKPRTPPRSPPEALAAVERGMQQCGTYRVRCNALDYERCSPRVTTRRSSSRQRCIPPSVVAFSGSRAADKRRILSALDQNFRVAISSGMNRSLAKRRVHSHVPLRSSPIGEAERRHAWPAIAHRPRHRASFGRAWCSACCGRSVRPVRPQR